MKGEGQALQKLHRLDWMANDLKYRNSQKKVILTYYLSSAVGDQVFDAKSMDFPVMCKTFLS